MSRVLLQQKVFIIILCIGIYLLFSFYLSIWLSTLIHELGHVIGSLLIGQPAKSVRIGSSGPHLKRTFIICGIKISVSLVIPIKGSPGTTELADTPLPVKHLFFYVLGGSANNLLAAFVCFGFLFTHLSLINLSLFWQSLFIFVFLLAFINLIMLLNLLPFLPGTDGWHSKNLLMFRKKTEIIIYHTMPRPVWVQYEGRREYIPFPTHSSFIGFLKVIIRFIIHEIREKV
ncbi:Peptidase family M50 [Desulfosporosinus acidiphilus SJ4]|uniref:Peptidase family M50 n=1 Tax=Desulfosporosinus acidiphilus (strain DSM 22704 / JCM 16185 / SJ4) TaxID=646529 RepID=I4DB24_DESAJ|nr:Peptidase family M50 [Desulfosporosinus acidiphilus SJ4]